MTGDPLTLGRGFDENTRSWTFSEDLVETRSRRLDAAFGQLAVFEEDADLTGSLVQIDTDAGLPYIAEEFRVLKEQGIMPPRK